MPLPAHWDSTTPVHKHVNAAVQSRDIVIVPGLLEIYGCWIIHMVGRSVQALT